MEENTILSFENFKHENGITYWWASELCEMLGYKDMSSFSKVIDRATRAFISLGIPHNDNIQHIERRNDDGTTFNDLKLTRFACYIIIMNGDTKKEAVALAQKYFAEQTRKFELFIQDPNQIDRLLIRDELTEGNKSLASVEKNAGVENYAFFQDAGYRGLYNMPLSKLKEIRNLGAKHNIADYMGRTELAANLFRVTQTEEKIKSMGVKGDYKLKETHYNVGKQIRSMVQENTGRNPEQLKQEVKLPEVKKGLKADYKKIGLIDKKK